MDINALVITTLSPLGYPVAFQVYEGTETTYITFNYEDDRAVLYADDIPQVDQAYIMVHLFAPESLDIMTIKRQVRSKLFKAGFSYPGVNTFHEPDTKLNHVVFRCSIAGTPESEET